MNPNGAAINYTVIEAFKMAAEKYPMELKAWEINSQAKIVVKTQSEKQLKEIYKKARDSDVPASLIEDDGLTQVAAGTFTCCAVGPGQMLSRFIYKGILRQTR